MVFSSLSQVSTTHVDVSQFHPRTGRNEFKCHLAVSVLILPSPGTRWVDFILFFGDVYSFCQAHFFFFFTLHISYWQMHRKSQTHVNSDLLVLSLNAHFRIKSLFFYFLLMAADSFVHFLAPKRCLMPHVSACDVKKHFLSSAC